MIDDIKNLFKLTEEVIDGLAFNGFFKLCIIPAILTGLLIRIFDLNYWTITLLFNLTLIAILLKFNTNL